MGPTRMSKYSTTGCGCVGARQLGCDLQMSVPVSDAARALPLAGRSAVLSLAVVPSAGRYAFCPAEPLCPQTTSPKTKGHIHSSRAVSPQARARR